MQISSFILFIKLESIVSNGNPKKAFLQDKVKECGDTYAQNNSDKEITLQMFLYSKFFYFVINSIFKYNESMPHFSSFVISYLSQNFEKLFINTNPDHEIIITFFSNDEYSQYFNETKLLQILMQLIIALGRKKSNK